MIMTTSTKPNRLASEQSGYLLQHAHNPVDWYLWDYWKDSSEIFSIDNSQTLSIG